MHLKGGSGLDPRQGGPTTRPRRPAPGTVPGDKRSWARPRGPCYRRRFGHRWSQGQGRLQCRGRSRCSMLRSAAEAVGARILCDLGPQACPFMWDCKKYLSYDPVPLYILWNACALGICVGNHAWGCTNPHGVHGVAGLPVLLLVCICVCVQGSIEGVGTYCSMQLCMGV